MEVQKPHRGVLGCGLKGSINLLRVDLDLMILIESEAHIQLRIFANAYDLVSAKLDTRPNYLSLGFEPDADPSFVSVSDLDRWVCTPGLCRTFDFCGLRISNNVSPFSTVMHYISFRRTSASCSSWHVKTYSIDLVLILSELIDAVLLQRPTCGVRL